MFYHSLLSDWNHGNAHFLRGIVTELLARGHEVRVYEPQDAWSVQNLLAEHGQKPIRKFRAAYPGLESAQYEPATLDFDQVLGKADLVLVHEWNAHDLVARIGAHHNKTSTYRLLFHDTHHRMVTAPADMNAYDLSGYDGVLAYGRVLADLYRSRKKVRRAWTWHEAADIRVFQPPPVRTHDGDLVWIGNWGDDERAAELAEFLMEPVAALKLSCRVYGVRYPAAAIASLKQAGIEYVGWLPNFEVPRIFGGFRFTLHVPRRPYVRALPGIPTIRPFEALACGIPLICSPWDDVEQLFRPGRDYLQAANGSEMRAQMETLLKNPSLGSELAHNGLETIRARHTCAHRVNELLAIYDELTTNT